MHLSKIASHFSSSPSEFVIFDNNKTNSGPLIFFDVFEIKSLKRHVLYYGFTSYGFCMLDLR